jgi:hypothetical protein
VTRLQPDTFCFVAPGLLHRFGNLLLSIQGHAHLVRGGDIERERAAILDAAVHGAETLALARMMLGEREPAPMPVGRVLDHLVEILRIPVRSRGRALRLLDVPADPPWIVDAGDVAVAASEAVRAVALGIPSAQPGSITIRAIADPPDAVLVAVQFEGEPGSLPFPLPGSGSKREPQGRPGGRIELRFEARRGSPVREA